ncbi:uncharacterized protein RNJ44_04445 [Nakaseomyces bracarensis]|uniref:Uncharacterized protein n=1 Tax=Nakaseomyces bracarensis TaxID=273131 RepID=A0ABR4NUY3_9SACH
MDAGISSLNRKNQPSQQKFNLRNNLLNSDVGGIDITQEVPVKQDDMYQPPQQQMMGNVPPQQYYPPQQMQPQMQPHMQMQQHMQQRMPYNNNQMYHQPQPPSGQQRQMYQQYPQASQVPPQQQYPRSQSLTQKSISNFFKPKGYHSPFGKSKKGGDDDDNEEGAELMDDPNASVITYSDIRKSANKGGDKYGYGGDTAPIIPTIVTTDKNSDYRKYMTTQKKIAMNRMAKQGIPPQTPSPPSKLQQYQQQQQMMGGNPRAMSLQGYGSGGSPFYQGPAPMGQNRGPNGQYNPDPRANSMMSTQNPMMRGPPGAPIQHPGFFQQPNGSGPINSQPPRTMSLQSGPPNRMAPPGNMRFGPSPMPQPQGPSVYPQQSTGERAMSLGTNVQKPTAFENTEQFDSNKLPPNPYLDYTNKTNSSEQLVTPTSEKPTHNLDISRPKQEKSPLKNQIEIEPLAISDDDFNTVIEQSSPVASGKLNVLQLSKPQQNENLEREIKESLGGMHKDNDFERALNLGDGTHKQWDEVSSERPAMRNDFKNGMSNEQKELENRTSLVENGLQSLKLDDRIQVSQPQRASVDTFASTFSESPLKKKINDKITGLYKLENTTDMNQYQTAQEFVNEAQGSRLAIDNRVESGSSSVYDTINDENKNTVAEENLHMDEDVERSHRRASLIKAKRFLSTLSTEDKKLSPSKSRSNTSVETLDSNQDDTIIQTNKREGTTSIKPVIEEKAEEGNEFIFKESSAQNYSPIYSKHDKLVKDKTKLESSSKMFKISEEQLNILTENKELMREVTLVSTELAESIQRETVLEEQIRDLSSPIKKQLDDGYDRDFEDEDERKLTVVEFEAEMRKKSSKIVELIQQLNEERLKRFIAEEQILLREHGSRPTKPELIYRIEQLTLQLDSKDSKIKELQERLGKYEQ